MSTAALALAALIVAAFMAVWLAAVAQALLHGARDWHDTHRRRRPGYISRR